VLGLLDWAKRKAREIATGVRDALGELIEPAAPAPVTIRPQPVAPKPVVVDNFAVWLKTNRAPACTACGSTATTFNELRKVRCNQCGSLDGLRLVAAPAGVCLAENCGLALVASGGVLRCQNHGQVATAGPVPRGVTFAQFRRNKFL